MLYRQTGSSPDLRAAQEQLRIGVGRVQPVPVAAADDAAGSPLPPIRQRGRSLTFTSTAATDDGDEPTLVGRPLNMGRSQSFTMGDRRSTGSLSLSDRLRVSQKAVYGATAAKGSSLRAGVKPNLSGVRSMFVSDCHFGVDELACPTRAQTPSTPWDPQPEGRRSANREQLGVRALRDLGILHQVQAGCDKLTGPGCEEVREAFRLLTVVEPPRAALLSTRVARAKPTLLHNPGAAHLLLLLEVGALYAAEDLKSAAALLLGALSPGGGYAGSPEVNRLYERVIGKVRFHRQFFDKQAPRLPDVDVRPPTPEPEPEPEVFLGSEWEGRLRRLHDLWSIEPKPQEALVQLRSELRDRISILSKMYLAYCSVEGHGQKIPQGRSFGVADSSLAAQLKTDGGNATAALENLLVVRVAIDTETEAEADGDIDEDESEEATNTADGAGEFKELHMTALHIGGLQGYLEADADALSALFSSFGQVIAVDIREREEKLNWALVSMLRADDAEYAVRKAKERMCKELQSHGDEFDASAVVVQPFDTRAALASQGGLAAALQEHHKHCESTVKAYEGGIEQLLELQNATPRSGSSGSESESESSSESEEEDDHDDGGGVGLTMDMCAHERVYIDKGCPKMFQFQWWRLMKVCRLPSPDLRHHEINGTFQRCQVEPPEPMYLNNLIAVGADEAVKAKQRMSPVDVWSAEIHHPHQVVNLYDFVELLVRVAHGRYPEVSSIAMRIRIMMDRDVEPRWLGGLDVRGMDAMVDLQNTIYDQFYNEAIAQGQNPEDAMETADADMLTKGGGASVAAGGEGGDTPKPKGKKKGKGGAVAEVDKVQLLYWRSDVQEWIADRSVRMWKVFHFMVMPSGMSREDPGALLSFNLLLKNLIWCELLDPELTVKRSANAVKLTTFDPDVAPQHHPSNDEVLLTYDEFEEAMVRFAKIKTKGTVPDDEFIEVAMVPFIEELFTQIAFKMPGRF